MRIKRNNLALRLVLVIVVLDHYYIAPQSPTVLGESHTAVSDHMNVLSKICIASTVTVPILTCVNSKAVYLGELCGYVPTFKLFSRSPVSIGTFSVGIANREIKTICRRDV